MMPSRKQIEAKPTSELLDDTYQLAMEARVRASMAVSDYRRGNLARLRRAAPGRPTGRPIGRRSGVGRVPCGGPSRSGGPYRTEPD